MIRWREKKERDGSSKRHRDVEGKKEREKTKDR
jgi:hypothetical protein